GVCQYGFDAYIEVIDILNVNCFTDLKNQMIFRVIENIIAKDQKTIDIPSINSEAHVAGFYEKICKNQTDQEYIRALFNYPIELNNIRNQAEILAKLSIARQAQESHQKAFKELENVKGNESIDDILKISEEPFQKLMTHLTHQDSVDVISEDIDDYISYLEDNNGKSVGVHTPFKIFNTVIGDGLRPGVHLIAARLKALKYGSKVYTKDGPVNIENIN